MSTIDTAIDAMNKIASLREYPSACQLSGKYPEEFRAIFKVFEDFEWLKSKISIKQFDKLPSNDKIKLKQIME